MKIRITEKDLTSMIAEGVKKILKEHDPDEREYDYDFPETPSLRHVYYRQADKLLSFSEDFDGSQPIPNTYEFEIIPFITKSHVENSGIGAYEFWGSPGYDRGEDYLVIDEVDYKKIIVYKTDDEGDYVRVEGPNGPEIWSDTVDADQNQYLTPDDEDNINVFLNDNIDDLAEY